MIGETQEQMKTDMLEEYLIENGLFREAEMEKNKKSSVDAFAKMEEFVLHNRDISEIMKSSEDRISEMRGMYKRKMTELGTKLGDIKLRYSKKTPISFDKKP
jgi:hypothetical protein